MSTNSNTRLLDSKAVAAIMTKRQPVPASAVGKKVVLTVQGDGNVIDVVDKAGQPVLSTIKGQEGVILQKKIFNCKANSQLAMTNARTRGYMIAGLAAEQKGNATAAHEEFNAYLNGCQLSFGIILPSATADALSNGVDIAAKVQLVTTDNGSLLTIDPSTISVQAPEYLDASTAFSLEDFAAPITATATTAKARKAAGVK